MQAEIAAADALIKPFIGAGAMTRGEARRQVQALLDRVPAVADLAQRWRDNEAEDAVRSGPIVWCVYEYGPDDTALAAAVRWLEDFAASVPSASGFRVAPDCP
jgi:hypothetical protein